MIYYFMDDTKDRNMFSYIYYDTKWREDSLTNSLALKELVLNSPKMVKFGYKAYKVDNSKLSMYFN